MLLLCGCEGLLQSNKVPVHIEFKPVIGHDTRVEGSMSFPQERSFSLWAQDSDGGLYIENAGISYNDGWFAPKPWDGRALTFYAGWPVNLDYGYSSSKGLQIRSFNSSKGYVDILLAEATEYNRADSPVTLNFNHLLSRVDFRMTHKLAENTSLKVNKIEIKGFAKKGDYNVTADDEWAGLSEYGSHVVFEHPDGKLVPSQTADYFGEEFYAIPQMSLGSIEVQCQIQYGVGQWVPQTYVIDPLEIVWDPGKHMTYTLTIRADQMVHTLGISAWENN